MKITEAKINWNHGYANLPTLELKADGVPKMDYENPIWAMQKNGIVWAQQDGVVEYLYVGNGITKNKNAMRGFGGHHFEIHLTDGTVIETNDVWSSRCSCVELQCAEVTINNRSSALRLDLFIYIVEKTLGQFIIHDGDDIAISSSPSELLKGSKEIPCVQKINFDTVKDYKEYIQFENDEMYECKMYLPEDQQNKNEKG